MIKKQQPVLIIFLLLMQNTFCQVTKNDTSATSLNKLNTYLGELSADTGMIHASWGFCLMDPQTGKILAQWDMQRAVMPASGMKVITTLSALNMLGANYKYLTTVEYDGAIQQDSILNGNIFIRGSGDPTLGSTRFDSSQHFDSLVNNWAREIKKKGIKKITGYIIGDASAFEQYATPGSWNWDDIGQYYGAGASGLNVYENTYEVYFSSTKTNTRIDSVYPAIDGLTFSNEVKPGSRTDEAYIYGAPDTYFRYILGNIPAYKKEYAVNGSMPDPPLFLASEFKKALQQNGITIEKQATTLYELNRMEINTAGERKVLIKTYSPPLSEIIFQTNQHSINLYAEALLKTIGKEKGEGGSLEAGIKAIEKYWTDIGFDMGGFNAEDGSGLSRLNTVTPQLMCAFLSYETRHKNFQVFKDALPVAGESGTLKTIAGETAARGRIFAKSGSMLKVRSYSGYVQTQNDKLYAFSIIVNNYSYSSSEIKSKLEKLMVLMAQLDQ